MNRLSLCCLSASFLALGPVVSDGAVEKNYLHAVGFYHPSHVLHDQLLVGAVVGARHSYSLQDFFGVKPPRPRYLGDPLRPEGPLRVDVYRSPVQPTLPPWHLDGAAEGVAYL